MHGANVRWNNGTRPVRCGSARTSVYLPFLRPEPSMIAVFLCAFAAGTLMKRPVMALRPMPLGLAVLVFFFVLLMRNMLW